MTTVLVSGYRSFELGIFQQNDDRVQLIKKAIRRDLERFCEEGLTWLVFTGNLGFEAWVLQVAKAMANEYEFSIATLFCFANQGENWSDANQDILRQFKEVDFVKYSFEAYTDPGQFKAYNQFLLENTDQAYLFYDEEQETSLKYLYNLMKEKAHPIRQLQFDDLNDIAMENE